MFAGACQAPANLSDTIDEDEEDINGREDDDWDFVEAPSAEDINGVQGKNLFARGTDSPYSAKRHRLLTAQCPESNLQINSSRLLRLAFLTARKRREVG